MAVSRKMKVLLGALFTGALSLGGAAGVYAQQTGGPPAAGAPQAPGAGMGGMGGMRGMGGGQAMDPAQMQQRMADMEKRRAEMQADRAQRMHDILQITPAQEGAFKAFQDAMKPPTPPKPPTQAELDARKNMTTTQRLDARMARVTERYNAAKTRTDATKRFYNALNPAQKKSFDALGDGMRQRAGMTRDGRGPGGPGMGRGMRGPMMGGGGPQPM
jgi:hypothetical protein